VIGAFEFHCTKTTDPFTDELLEQGQDHQSAGRKDAEKWIIWKLELQDICKKKKKSFAIVLVPNSQSVAKIDCGYRYLYS